MSGNAARIRGYAFIQFKTAKDAATALEKMNGKELMGKLSDE